MADLADKALEQVEAEISKVYAQAQKEITASLKEFEKKFKAEDKAMQKQMKAGAIDKADYDTWKEKKVFQSDLWKQKKDDIVGTLYNANQHAVNIVAKERKAVFSEAHNREAFKIDADHEMGLSFDIYDSATVTNLIRRNPELLPRKVVNGKKDRAWNKTKISNCITQSIIQGESIPDTAKRLAKKLASDDKTAMRMYARTAMTGAQNAGRMEAMHEAQDMGIKIKKKWLATLDARTRDSHQMLDGQVKEVDEDFISPLGKIAYPGDPNAEKLGDVYNCRCTLTYVYPDYKFGSGMRRNQTTGEEIGGMTYEEWKHAKENNAELNASVSKNLIDDLQDQIVYNDAEHVFKGIWKDDVTYADWETKKASIPAKRDYLTKAIARAIQNGDATEEARLRGLLQELDLFEQNGQKNYQLLEDYKQELAFFKKATKDNTPPKPSASVFGADAYSQARLDGALWDTQKNVDAAMRDKTGELWRAASKEEKDAIFEYTHSYHKFNEPLRGIEYGTNAYKGVGNTDLNAGYAKNGPRLNALTDLLNKSSYDHDIWLQRGVGFDGMEKFFNCDLSLLMNGTQGELEQALLGKTVTEYAFMSCGSAKGMGFSTNPIIFNIYAPSGTKMMYVEPFSYYGHNSKGSMNYDDGIKWDGYKKQPNFGTEFETLLQQGTQMKVAKIERRGRSGTIYMDLYVVDQSTQQRWVP